MRKVAVVGAGASGLATAFYLTNAGFNVELFERDKKIGGRMSTSNLNGKEVCLGGKNIGKTYQLYRDFCRHFGVTNFEDFGLNSSNGQKDKVKTFDSEKRFKSFSSFAKELPLSDIIKLIPLLIAIKLNRRNAYLSGNFFKKFSRRNPLTVNRYFSEKLQNRLLRPLIVRNNGAEPDEVSMETLGTNLAMILDSYEQLSDGPSDLFESFAKTVKVHTDKDIRNLIMNDSTVCGIQDVEDNIYEFDAVVLATTANVSSKIMENAFPRLSDALNEIRYNPVAVVVSEYENNVFTDEQRAFTFPDSSVLSNAGAYGKSDRNIVRYTFSGKEARNLLSDSPDIDKLMGIAGSEIIKHTPVRPGKLLGYTGAVIRNGLCSYTISHFKLLTEIKHELRSAKNVFLAGDYLEGVSIEGCFRSGYNAAKDVAKSLS